MNGCQIIFWYGEKNPTDRQKQTVNEVSEACGCWPELDFGLSTSESSFQVSFSYGWARELFYCTLTVSTTDDLHQH